MTMQVIDAVTLEQSGVQIQEVTPGGLDDPFTAQNQATSPAANLATPASLANVGGGAQVPPGDGTPASTPPPATPAANPQPTSVAPQTPATPQPVTVSLDALLADEKLAEDLKTWAQEKVLTPALRAQQSSYDKTINKLQEDIKGMREAALKAEREAKLNNDLTDEEKELLQKSWEIEDRERALDEREEAVDEYWHSVLVARLSGDYAPYGVTAEELEAIEDPDEMVRYAERKELDFYRGGGAPKPTTVVPSSVVTPNPQPEVPAGAVAPTDVGGNAPVMPPAQLQEGTGADVMAANMAKLTWESVPVYG